jgi:ribonuclease E
VAAAGVATAAPLGDQDAAGDAAEPEAADETDADDEATGEPGAPAKRRRRGRRGGRGRGRGKRGLTARIERADGEIVVRIDAAALTGAAAEAWADAETAALTVTEAGLQLAPEAPAAD